MRADRALAALHGAELNFEPQPLEYYTPERGWHADALSQWLPNEPPGDPVPGGAWEIARRLVEDYRMADPAIVRAVWDPSVPLLGRDMLLELRLYRVLSVHAGVRVTRVWDEERVLAGRAARVFGFEYATLPGHVELGGWTMRSTSGSTTARSSSGCIPTPAPRRTARPGPASATASSAVASKSAFTCAAATGSPGSRHGSSGCPTTRHHPRCACRRPTDAVRIWDLDPVCCATSIFWVSTASSTRSGRS